MKKQSLSINSVVGEHATERSDGRADAIDVQGYAPPGCEVAVALRTPQHSCQQSVSAGEDGGWAARFTREATHDTEQGFPYGTPLEVCATTEEKASEDVPAYETRWRGFLDGEDATQVAVSEDHEDRTEPSAEEENGHVGRKTTQPSDDGAPQAHPHPAPSASAVTVIVKPDGTQQAETHGDDTPASQRPARRPPARRTARDRPRKVQHAEASAHGVASTHPHEEYGEGARAYPHEAEPARDRGDIPGDLQEQLLQTLDRLQEAVEALCVQTQPPRETRAQQEGQQQEATDDPGGDEALSSGTNSFQDRLQAALESIREEVHEAIEEARAEPAPGRAEAENGENDESDTAEQATGSAQPAREEKPAWVESFQNELRDLLDGFKREEGAASGDTAATDATSERPTAQQAQGEAAPATDSEATGRRQAADEFRTNRSPRRPQEEHPNEHEPERRPTNRRFRSDTGGAGPAPPCPSIHFAPAEIGERKADAKRTTTLQVTVEGEAGQELVAALMDKETKEELACEQSRNGSLTLIHENDYTPGEYAVAVEVREPEGCAGTSYTFRVPSSPADEDEEDAEAAPEETEAEDAEGSTTRARLVGAAWALLLALFLLIVAAGTNPILVGPSLALVILFTGTHLASRPGEGWARWTGVGVAVAALGVLALLPSTALIRMDGSLMAAGAVAAGFLSAAAIVYFR